MPFAVDPKGTPLLLGLDPDGQLQNLQLDFNNEAG